MSQLSPSFSELIIRAAEFHKKRAFAEAEEICRQILTFDARHVGALHLLGVVMVQTGRLENGVELLDKALAIKPDDVEALNNRGMALKALKRLDEALASYDRALGIKRDYLEALNNRGMALQELKRLDEALASYDEALAIKPDFVLALNNRGIALQGLKRLDEALASYDKALAIRPDSVETLNNRGMALRGLKRLEEALASYAQALSVKPGYADALNNRGIALQELKRLDEALASYDQALAFDVDHLDALCNRGKALMELKRPDEALASYDKALAIKPDYVDALSNRGIALRQLKRFDEALANFDAALAIEREDVEASVNKGYCLLQLGCLAEGWSLNENRKRTQQVSHFTSRAFLQPCWDGGEPLAGVNLFVYWEQGLGDNLQFCRYAKLAEQRGAKVVFSAPNRLHKLLRTLSPTMRIIGENEAPAQFDRHCAILSLPFAFATVLETIPAETPYLRAEPERIRKWSERLGGEGFKIGVAWQGNKMSPADVGRSFPLAEADALSRIPNVRLISLQKNDGVEQLFEAPQGMKVETLGDDYDAGDDAFLDAAAVMEGLDLVISCDSALAHLAGALGRPVWVALKYVPDWRWLLERTGSPWYPTMRLFRQEAREDWRGVFTEIEGALRELIGSERQQAKKYERPSTPATLSNRGLAFQELKRLDDALRSGDEALPIKLVHFDALCVRGKALMELKRLDEALASYDEALAIKSDSVLALNNRGAALYELKRYDEALASYNKALAIKSDCVEISSIAA